MFKFQLLIVPVPSKKVGVIVIFPFAGLYETIVPII
jgi:hypothetical protein